MRSLGMSAMPVVCGRPMSDLIDPLFKPKLVVITTPQGMWYTGVITEIDSTGRFTILIHASSEKSGLTGRSMKGVSMTSHVSGFTISEYKDVTNV